MSVRTTRHISVVVATALLASLVAARGEPARRVLTTQDCERLVAQLVNPGKRPFKGYVNDLPAGLTESGLYQSQKPIAAAYNELSANIEQALAVLEAHRNDDRFSYVYEDGVSGVYECATVGEACGRILGEHINVYLQAVAKYDEDGRVKSLWFKDEARGKEMGKARPSLAELQLQRIEWALQQPQPDYFSKQEWAKAKESLQKLAQQIRDSKQPILVKHRVQFFSK